MKIHWLRPEEFPVPQSWMTFYSERVAKEQQRTAREMLFGLRPYDEEAFHDEPHFLGVPRRNAKRPSAAKAGPAPSPTEPLLRSIDGLSA